MPLTHFLQAFLLPVPPPLTARSSTSASNSSSSSSSSKSASWSSSSSISEPAPKLHCSWHSSFFAFRMHDLRAALFFFPLPCVSLQNLRICFFSALLMPLTHFL